MYHRVEHAIAAFAKWMAIAGGCILLALTALTCISIFGRAFVPFNIGIGPIRGIYDITEIGIAAAVFAFLPWAQYQEAHARVDLFQNLIPDKAERALDLLFHIAMSVVATVGTWRLYLGMLDKRSHGETTLIAEIPVWQGFAIGLIGASGFVIIALFCVLRALRRLIGADK